jgi:hypothetical protein
VGVSRTEAIYVVFTGGPETRAAVRAAEPLSAALGSPLTVVDFRVQPYPLKPKVASLTRPAQAEEFAGWLQQHDAAAKLRVFVCRDPRQAFDTAFRPHSLIVVGGNRRWWPTRSTRLQRALESAGHLVLFVDEASRAS